MKALSIRSPWWWFILYAGKDIENRDWNTNFRGRVLIHASKWWNLEEVGEDSSDALYMRGKMEVPVGNPAEITFRQMRDMGGCVVGSVEVVECVSRSKSPWFVGKYGFVLANPVAFDKPVPRKGALGIFEVEW
jgi:hypothetical protein